MTAFADRGLDEVTTRFYGRYRGTVTRNDDCERRGRVQVSCPAVLADKEVWALPSSPYAGLGLGLFTVPPVHANVWVEFEGGHHDHPIVVGCFWGEREKTPSTNGLESTKVLKTGCLTLTIDDTAGKVTLEVAASTGPLTVTLDTSGITLENRKASVKLGTTTVSVNGGALEVT